MFLLRERSILEYYKINNFSIVESRNDVNDFLNKKEIKCYSSEGKYPNQVFFPN